MLKKTLYALCGAFIAAMVGTTYALVVGTPPGTGPQLVDGAWLNGLANGFNNSYQSSVSTAGTSSATATQITSGVRLVEIDTSAGGAAGLALPSALKGTIIQIFNNGASTAQLSPSASNNPITAAADTINNTVTFGGITPTNSVMCFSARDGFWACK